MLFNSEHFEKLQQRHQQFRPIIYLFGAIPLLFYIVAIFTISTETLQGHGQNLEVVSAAGGQPPYLVYLLLTVFMIFFTIAWTAFIYCIWKLQGMLIQLLAAYFKRSGN